MSVSNLTAKQNQASVLNGTVLSPGGTNTGAYGANVIAAAGFTMGTASQLSDATRDYTVYLTVGTAGTAGAVKIGPTSAVANTLVTGAALTSGQVITVRLPAGWYLEISATTATLAASVAVSC